MIQAIKDRVICKIVTEEEQKVSFVDKSQEPYKVEVVSVGPETTQVKVGSMVLLAKQGAGVKFTYEGNNYINVKEEGITAIV